MNPLLKKLNAKAGQHANVLHAPEKVRELLTVDADDVVVVEGLRGRRQPIEWMLGFAQTQARVDELAAVAASRTTGDATVWIAYPKQSSKRHRCEFNRDTGWDALGEVGLEPIRQVSIDEDWSALRFRRVEHIKTLTRRDAMTEEGRRRSSGMRPLDA